MQLLVLRIIIFLALALAYMLFDIFNNRNVPSYFAYASLMVGAVFTLLYLNLSQIFYSTLIAIATLGFGYVVYRIGQLGAADVIEIAALSMIIPFMGKPLIYGVTQSYMPVALSIAINSGIAALIVVPLYYIPKALHVKTPDYSKSKKQSNYFRIALIITVYAFFGAFLFSVLHASYAAIVLLAIIALGSALVLAFEDRMMAYMSQYVTYKNMEPGDIIATGMMKKREINVLEKKLVHFERLVGPELLKELKTKLPSHKFPVYKKPIPFAVPIFIGVVATIAFGNVLLLLLPAYP